MSNLAKRPTNLSEKDSKFLFLIILLIIAFTALIAGNQGINKGKIQERTAIIKLQLDDLKVDFKSTGNRLAKERYGQDKNNWTEAMREFNAGLIEDDSRHMKNILEFRDDLYKAVGLKFNGGWESREGPGERDIATSFNDRCIVKQYKPLSRKQINAALIAAAQNY